MMARIESGAEDHVHISVTLALAITVPYQTRPTALTQALRCVQSPSQVQSLLIYSMVYNNIHRATFSFNTCSSYYCYCDLKFIHTNFLNSL